MRFTIQQSNMDMQVKRKLLYTFFLLVITWLQLNAQQSFIKIVLPANGLLVRFEPVPVFQSRDSAVYSNVMDDSRVNLLIVDTTGRHKDLNLDLVIKPFSITTVTVVEHGRRKLKIYAIEREYYLPGQHCKQSTPLALVERSIVDMMLIDHIGARKQEAKKFIRSHCLTFRQIKGLVMMFPSDKDRLEIAEYAYFFARDYYNYFLLRDAFSSKATYKEFESFVKNVLRNFNY